MQLLGCRGPLRPLRRQVTSVWGILCERSRWEVQEVHISRACSLRSCVIINVSRIPWLFSFEHSNLRTTYGSLGPYKANTYTTHSPNLCPTTYPPTSSGHLPRDKMGIFGRRQHVTDGQATTTLTTPTTKTSRKRHGNSSPYYSMATRPSFGQWLKYTWLDILTMVIMGIIGLGVCDIFNLVHSLRAR